MQITGSKFAFSGSRKIEDISDSFEQYRIDSKKLNQWKGVQSPHLVTPVCSGHYKLCAMTLSLRKLMITVAIRPVKHSDPLGHSKNVPVVVSAIR